MVVYVTEEERGERERERERWSHREREMAVKRGQRTVCFVNKDHWYMQAM